MEFRNIIIFLIVFLVSCDFNQNDFENVELAHGSKFKIAKKNIIDIKVYRESWIPFFSFILEANIKLFVENVLEDSTKFNLNIDDGNNFRQFATEIRKYVIQESQNLKEINNLKKLHYIEIRNLYNDTSLISLPNIINTKWVINSDQWLLISKDFIYNNGDFQYFAICKKVAINESKCNSYSLSSKFLTEYNTRFNLDNWQEVHMKIYNKLLSITRGAFSFKQQ